MLKMSKTPKNKHARHRKNERSGRPTPPHAPRGGGAPNRGRLRTLTATLEKNRKGFGFLIFDHAEWEDLYIPPNEARRFFPGDRLLVALTSHPGGAEVVSLKLLEHRYKELVGRFISGTVVYESRKGVHFEIPTQRGALFGGKRIPEGHWVRVKLVYEGPHQMVGEVQEVYGESVPASADVEMIAGEFGLIEPHSKEAVSEALAFGKIVPEESLKQKGRKNLRDLPFITIDGETARDFDDAVHVARTAKGFTLWVAIADVSHYVKPGSTIDKEAFARGTSVYFPERAFHMLPSALSENLCSLRPNEPRLALVCEMDFDKEGERTGTLIYDAVIESKRRTTYTEIEKEGAAEWPDLFALYKILRRARTNRGSIDFELPDAEVVTDIRPGKYGEPLEIENRSRLDSHRLIEEFMIAANEAVTVWALERNLPFIYRVHAEPSPEALVKFAELAAQVGEEAPFIERPKTERGRGQGHGHGHGAKQGRSRSFKKARAHQASAPRSIAPKVLADFVRKLEGRSTQALLNTALLRAMKQAVYTDIHGIHFGLASTAYTHFTSPIRRYPDLIVHRLLKEAVQAERESNQRKSGHSGGVMSAKLREWRDELGKQAEHCSYRERLAADADREAIRVKQVRIMQKHLGDVFEGKISGLAIKGIFVQITSPFVEGLIPMDALSDDQYEYNEERMVISGRKKKRTFQIGDKIEVQVVRADFEKRQVELGLAELASS